MFIPFFIRIFALDYFKNIKYMILLSFGYKEQGWELSELNPLKPVNLLVAKNATGKTKTIRALQNVTSLLQMKETFMGISSFEADLLFVDPEKPEWKLFYSFKVDSGEVEKEVLKVNDTSLINRTKEIAEYRSTKINPPSEKLVVQIRRDKDLFPEIELLMTWAEGVTIVSCSNINPFAILGTGMYINPYSFRDLVDTLSSIEINNVLEKVKRLGYNIESIKTVDAANGLKWVQIKESSVSNEMVDIQLSSGMLRTMYLLFFMSAIRNNKKLSMLLIDDLGEGLDYRRSIDLGKTIFEDCAHNKLQLIASSNDAFLMDVVDIANWQVLRRTGSTVSSINQTKNPDLFRKFRMTGLSNFDFFSSDFIDSYIGRER